MLSGMTCYHTLQVDAASGQEGALVTFCGLQNQLGENNCFLNAVVQALFHSAAVQAWLAAVTPEMYQVPTMHCPVPCY